MLIPAWQMGSIKKLRLLCLHSFRTSAHIFQKQMERAMWTQHFAEQLDMVSIATELEGKVKGAAEKKCNVILP